MAVDRWLTATATRGDSPSAVTIDREGAVASITCDATDDLVYLGFAAACARTETPVPGRLHFELASNIPVARGLGSSAAALVAGAALADALLALQLGTHGIATLVSQIEGHPDNAAPAAFGGAMLGVARNDATDARACTYAFSALPIHRDLTFVFVVPSLEVTTASARAVLPASVPFHDAVAAVQRSAALTHGLATGDAELLARALDDVLHVPYRRLLIPGYDAVVAAAVQAGAFGATLSGSGSAMLAICRANDAEAVAEKMRNAFQLNGLPAESILTAGPVAGLRTEYC
jgi:homoserine kinase